ncbi:hypothetical protein HanIR_Chr16g0824361 [Helianthus annuus]|nr:hypothetical protein HanIR_Chr16g0824361 [Helianthus annuus]
MRLLINYQNTTLLFLTNCDIMRLISSSFSLRLELTKAIDNKCINKLPLGYCRSQSVVKLVATCLSLSLESSCLNRIPVDLSLASVALFLQTLQAPPFVKLPCFWDRRLAFRINKLETCTTQPLYYKPIKL